MALYLCGDSFTAEQKRRDFEYYEAITVRDSTLSASIQAIVAAEVGCLELAHDYFRETAFIDLHDRAGNTGDGLHLASPSGALMVAVVGFGGMRDYGDTLAFAPRLPPSLTRLTFRILYCGRRIGVEISPDHACYELLAGEPLEVLHHGEPLILMTDSPQSRKVSPALTLTRAEPPLGRDVRWMGVGADRRGAGTSTHAATN